MSGKSASFNRRDVLRNSVVASAAVVAGTATSASAATAAERKIPDGVKTILFQGDSITDAGRDRKRQSPNNSGGLGRGYPMLIGGGLLTDYPTRELMVHNRGISGNKVPDLQNRWQQDCLDLKPDILSILIGVNDIWHKLSGRYDGTVDDYRNGYRDLLKQTQAALPDTKIVICEPFVLRCGAVNDKWFPEFDHRREAAVELAAELSLTLVPFQQMFDKAVENTPPAYWAGDGVHPSLAGHTLMAQTWRDVVGI